MGAFKGIDTLKSERLRQVAEEGYSIEGDQGRTDQLHRAGIAYLQYALLQQTLTAMGQAEEIEDVEHPADVIWIDDLPLWLWDREDWKPGTVLENMIKGGALIAAALDHPEEINDPAGVEVLDLTKYDDEGTPITDSKGRNLEDGWG
ncbi:MAG: hypothetical protein RR853_08900 [Aurantimicrobium sp.]|uniref:hypothetical protein n=1 Tax=Aurantimicrobium sp. TaxID=1930784 RepID=UPI002FC81F0B